ncbi:MAG TPA: hypothetical protein VIM99_03545 [Blastocatellia bacterium]
MRSPQWFLSKNMRLPAALYSALWWGGCVLFCYAAPEAIASADLQSARAAAIQSGRGSLAAENGRHSVPASKVPQRAVFHACGALNSFVLRHGRKPGPYDSSSPATLATCPYPNEDREPSPPPSVAPRRLIGRGDIYLQCCSLLI